MFLKLWWKDWNCQMPSKKSCSVGGSTLFSIRTFCTMLATIKLKFWVAADKKRPFSAGKSKAIRTECSFQKTSLRNRIRTLVVNNRSNQTCKISVKKVQQSTAKNCKRKDLATKHTQKLVFKRSSAKQLQRNKYRKRSLLKTHHFIVISLRQNLRALFLCRGRQVSSLFVSHWKRKTFF